MVASTHNAKKPMPSRKRWHGVFDSVWHCHPSDLTQSSRYVARVAWDRMGWPTLPRLGGGMFWAGHRAVSQTILLNVCVRFSYLRWPARRGKVSRHFFTFADDDESIPWEGRAETSGWDFHWPQPCNSQRASCTLGRPRLLSTSTNQSSMEIRRSCGCR